MKWETIFAVDSDRWAIETYRANFPFVDSRYGTVNNLLLNLPPADVIIGGPPCQPFSEAGDNKGEEDARDGIPDFAAAVELIRPRMFLMENVAGILNANHLRYVGELLARFERQGYILHYQRMDAVQFGVPQFRDRVWFWGIRFDLYTAGVRHRWPKATHCWPPQADGLFGAHALSPGITVGQALGLEGLIVRHRGKEWGERRPHLTTEPAPTILGGSGDGGSTGAIYHYRWSDEMLRKHPPASPWATAPTVLGTWEKGGAVGLLAIDATLNRPSPTISAGSHTGGPEPVNNRIRAGFVRRLVPDECSRLQSVHDAWRWPHGISKTAKYRIIGNGWASRMGAVFADAFRAADPESRTVIDLFCGGGLGAAGWHGNFWSYQGVES